MKKKIAFMAALVLLSCSVPLTVFADETTGAYIPEGLPVATDTVEFVDAETAAILFDMRDQLHENVFVNYPDSEVHAVVASNIVNKVYVSYTSSDSEELSEAKKYCEEHNFDLDIMRFYLYSEENLVDESYNGENSGLITNHETIVAMLNDFIKENQLAEAFASDNKSLGKVILSYYYVHPEQEDVFKNFINEKNIDANEVEFWVMEGAIEIPDEENTTEETVVLEKGDANGDTKIDILDIITINKAVLGKEKLTDEQNQAADVNENNKVDSGDALMLMKFVVGLIDSFDIQ